MARIIVVDDHEMVGAMLSETLINRGHSVGWLDDGAVALQAMKRRAPHLVILDQNMPGMTGRCILRAMRTHAELFKTPVIMLTAIDSEADERIAYYDGADHYMTKPFDPQELVFWAEELIARRSAPELSARGPSRC